MENLNKQCENEYVLDRIKSLCKEKGIRITELEDELEIKDGIQKNLDKVAKYFNVSKTYITHGCKFQKFTPIDSAQISIYKDALEFAINDNEIKNVAITGPYSAGKSSVLESYKFKNDRVEVINISLAHFQSTKNDNTGKLKKSSISIDEDEANHEKSIESHRETLSESVIEGKILNQLIHQIPADRIPQSNFRTKKDVNNPKLKQRAVLITCFIVGIAILMYSNNIISFANTLPDGDLKNIMSFIVSPAMMGLSLIICPVLACKFIYSLLLLQKNKNIFKKINFQGNGIEILEESDDSYFDKYLNDVLYLFENVEANVIVFEDIDRFENNSIFVRLREINTLVNIQRRKEQGDNYHPLKFFYLLRDDIFVSKDRTKFFDFIIPIIPIVDSSNSYDIISKNLENAGILYMFDKGFLEGLSLYIDDMRILKNIYNEFIVYFNRLNVTDLDSNKMMAIVTYKNIFPRDFSELQLCKGYIYQLFNREKEKLVIEKTKDLKSRLEALEMRINAANNEMLQSIEEFENIFFANERKYQMGIITPNQFNSFRKNYESQKQSREMAIRDKEETEQKKIQKEIAKNKNEISIIREKSLKTLLLSHNTDVFFDFKYGGDISGQDENEFTIIRNSDYFDLFKYLIRDGYIDETYPDYLTYFHENRMSINDKKFLQRITGRKGADYTYGLNKVENVMNSAIIGNERFKQVETLNFDLLEYMLENQNKSKKYIEYIETLFNQIMENENYDFVSRLYEILLSTDKQRNLVRKINELCPSFFCEVLKNNCMTDFLIKQLSIDIFYYTNLAMIDYSCDGGLSLADYVSGNENYLNIVNPDIEKLIEAFKEGGIIFEAIDSQTANPELFEKVYQEWLYELNYENIALMLQQKYEEKNENDIKHRNLTLILKKPDLPLASYIFYNMPIYMREIHDHCEDEIWDDENAVRFILNDEYLVFSNVEENIINDVLKRDYIKVLQTQINEIKEIENVNLWTILMNNNNIKYSVENIIEYFIEKKLDLELKEFINKGAIELDFSSVAWIFDEEIEKRFFNAICICNEVDLDKYKEILSGLDCEFDNFEMEEINDDKFEMLIETGVLKMNVESLAYVRDKYRTHLFSYINKNLDKYIEIQNNEILVVKEVIEILNWNDVSNEQKLDLLSNTEEKISVIDNTFSDIVCAYLIKNNRNKADEPILYKRYSDFENLTQNTIADLATNLVSEITSRKLELDDLLLSKLLKTAKIDRAQKIVLLENSSVGMDVRTWEKHFDELDLKELKNIFKKNISQIKYEKNEEISRILVALKNNKFIYDFILEEGDPEKYLVIKEKINGILD